MGWNAGYRAMESSVIAVYNTGKLTPTMLDAMMEPYKGTDCDSGGSMNLKSNDGLGVEEIICKIMEPEKYQNVIDNPVWYEGEEPDSGHNHGWSSNGAAYDLFWSIWNGYWDIC